tara:strand:- start:374 stop:2701 length:2328 start_codon:yes stop_codon:yes gene_type:complete
MSESGMSGREFNEWWQNEIIRRVPDFTRSPLGNVSQDVDIFRDELGIPHIRSSSADDLFYGYGYAMAQDRLWQMDYLRRKALGTLSEVIGSEGLDRDVVSRTLGIRQISERETGLIESGTANLLESFSKGINRYIDESYGNLPIEFDLLSYEPEPWKPQDSISIWCDFRWYLTGRLSGIALCESAKQLLKNPDLYRAFLTTEADDESIVSVGNYDPDTLSEENIFQGGSGPYEGLGSNNWVIGPNLTQNGMPILASDPHIAFGAVSCWYQVHLSGDYLNVAGGGYVGVPFLMFGRNEHVSWGLTNNICSQRDLYREKSDPQRPDHYLFDGNWEQSVKRVERIEIRDAEPVDHLVSSTRNGPIVNELLSPNESSSDPISLKWMGQFFSDEMSCFHTAHKATNISEFREAFREFKVPTFSIAFADTQGHIGYQCVGSIPVRRSWDRGYLQGWNTDHQWKDIIPFESMPFMIDPPEGWIRSANNRTAPGDFPYPLSGMWPSGLRAKRIRHMIESDSIHSLHSVSKMQVDVLSLRAASSVPILKENLSDTDNVLVGEALAHFASWDFRMNEDSVPAIIFEEFFNQWCLIVAAQRFSPEFTKPISAAIGGLAFELLSSDNYGWFTDDRKMALGSAMTLALQRLRNDLGDDMDQWSWGHVNKAYLPHHLSDVGDLGKLLDRGGGPVSGTSLTVGNVGAVPYSMSSGSKGVGGANYRIVVDMSEPGCGLWTVDHSGQSGHPGSSNYGDQFQDWIEGGLHYLSMEWENLNRSGNNSYKIRSGN